MRIGIIDFGTNTLRLNIFETEDSKYAIIYDEIIYSKIVENTFENRLTQDGIEHIIQAIEQHLSVCRHYRCDMTECFSTASLRYISNSNEVLEQVEFRTGLKICMISGDMEANYDYMALKSVIDTESGIGCDLGGGSLQVFTFNENGPLESKSFPFGSSRIYKQYVNGAIPTAGEIETIKNTISSEIERSYCHRFGNTLFAMGGTAKSIEKVCSETLNITGNISKNTLNALLYSIIENPEESEEFFEDKIPSRKNTITPGIAILYSVMDVLGCEEMKVLTVGVREGFLEEKLKNPDTTPGILDIISGLI